MKLLLVVILSLSLTGATRGVTEITCEEIDTSIVQIQRWINFYGDLVGRCEAGKWETHAGSCVAAAMTYDAIIMLA